MPALLTLCLLLEDLDAEFHALVADADVAAYL
jgi:hypothetical protein